ncbi:hypothetical protein BY996DRAFT_4580394 [Phakopsora pachyrhizi]|nr:hypothetical protein BY996DRAFT_4580394 [Phakopsora pachyrhizi]
MAISNQTNLSKNSTNLTSLQRKSSLSNKSSRSTAEDGRATNIKTNTNITLSNDSYSRKRNGNSLGPSNSFSSNSSTSSSASSSESSSSSTSYSSSSSSFHPTSSFNLSNSHNQQSSATYSSQVKSNARPQLKTNLSSPSIPALSTFTSIASELVSPPDWLTSVPKELIGSLQPSQILRQSVIHEIISGEADYVEDLLTYQKIFISAVQDLTPPAIFQPSQLERFSNVIVSSLPEITELNLRFLSQLLERKSKESPLIESIGDIILDACLNWGQSYITYSKDHPLGQYEIQQLTNNNPLFSELIEAIPKLNSFRKDFRHFYSRPTFRFARYILLFKRLLELTPVDHRDHELLQISLELITQQTSECDAAIQSQEELLKLAQLDQQIIHKPEFPLLHLLSPNRKFYFLGAVIRKKDTGAGLSEWGEVILVLLDNYLVILKPKKDDQQKLRYAVVDQPIRVEFIKITCANGPVEKRSRRLKNLLSNVGSINSGSISAGLSSPNLRRALSEPGVPGPNQLPDLSFSSPSSRYLYPFTIQSFGTFSKSISFYVDSERLRMKWIDHFEKAIGKRLQALKSSQVFELRALTQETFSVPNQPHEASRSHNVNSTQLPSMAELKLIYGDQIPKELVPNSVHYGAPTCSVPFFSPDGRKLVAIGSPLGLWIGKANDSSSIRQVLLLKDIVQCSVLQEHNYMIVLAGKVLLAYPLELLTPSSRAGDCEAVIETREKPCRPAVGYQEALQNSQRYSLGKFEFEDQKSPKAPTSPYICTPGLTPPPSVDVTPTSTVPNTPTNSTITLKEPNDPPQSHYFTSKINFNESPKRNSQLCQIDLRKREPIRLSLIGVEVDFFRIGNLGDIKLLIYSEKALKKTVFRVLEPVKERNRTVFQQHPEFTVGFEADGLDFHETRMKLELIRGNSCEIMNMESLTSDSIPHVDSLTWIETNNDFNSIKNSLPQQEAVVLQILKKKIEGGKLLRIAQVDQKEYLFCYDSFAYFANKNGDPIRKKMEMMIEWDEKLKKVVKISHYVIGYSEEVIEVWDLKKCERVQLIHGKDIECIYDGHLNECPKNYKNQKSQFDCEDGQQAKEQQELKATVHVSIRDSGQVYRVFEMGRLTQ